ncbi:efflux RND transporter periplasmic adaptor subunit [Dyadobacter subterraneus]|uniref:Efflux RND transporter periplasmic adaptor subunit n=1 Tax=Dyadobacter subterraneus TaxID=2773304 RepID=A0ABR9WBJ1_9BACT|nr:efflux RND transporter periplasmic adaptor subunit [Dyadobacter subterraneus]MBE9462854.1 efflux RND transporter periplasmic adaptor subunit [Dyadobacter subterraneus]
MKNFFKYGWLFGVLLIACEKKENKSAPVENVEPKISENGARIEFPKAESVKFFKTETIGSSSLTADITAPATVSATVVKSNEGASQNIVLFQNPELAGSYTQLIQHLITINQIQNVNIKQRKIELGRVQDLQAHGAATGKDLLDAQTAMAMEETNLNNERAALIEHETKLKEGGFQAELLRKAKAGTAYITCDIPENDVSKIKSGSQCILQFTAFPNEKFTGKIDNVADMVDPATRMIKLRVSLNNSDNKLKAGMFGTLMFGVSEGKNISVSKDAIITIQGKNYVFVKDGTSTFKRKEVNIGDQVGDRIIVFSGLNNDDSIAIKGVMQLKGLSFGY